MKWIDKLDLAFGRHVIIDEQKLQLFSRFVRKKIRELRIPPSTWDDPKFYLDKSYPPDERSQYYTVLNSINFRFWSIVGKKRVPVYGTKDGEDFYGTQFMQRCLKLAYEKDHDLISAKNLADMPVSRLEKIFEDDYEKCQMPLLKERAQNLNDLGRRLLKNWNGKFYSLLNKCDGYLYRKNGKGYLQLVNEFQAFKDPLKKLALLNAKMLEGSATYSFKDEENKHVMVDYLLPTELLRIGVLEIKDQNTKTRLQQQIMLEYDEVAEIRNATLLACANTRIQGFVLDDILWWNSVIFDRREPRCDEILSIPALSYEGPCFFEEICEAANNLELRIIKTFIYGDPCTTYF